MNDIVEDIIEKVNFKPELKNNTLVEIRYMITELQVNYPEGWNSNEDPYPSINDCEMAVNQQFEKKIHIVDDSLIKNSDYFDTRVKIDIYLKNNKDSHKIPLSLLQVIDRDDSYRIQNCDENRDGIIALSYKIMGQVINT